MPPTLSSAAATKALESKSSQNHSRWQLLLSRGWAFIRENRPADALSDADKYLKLKPNGVQGFVLRAIALSNSDRAEEAVRCLLTAVTHCGSILDKDVRTLEGDFACVRDAMMVVLNDRERLPFSGVGRFLPRPPPAGFANYSNASASSACSSSSAESKIAGDKGDSKADAKSSTGSSSDASAENSPASSSCTSTVTSNSQSPLASDSSDKKASSSATAGASAKPRVRRSSRFCFFVHSLCCCCTDLSLAA